MLRFEWDPIKAEWNHTKHGVSFEEAVTVFADPWSLTIPDPEHSNGEIRELILGRSIYSELLVVSFTTRGYTLRLISARRASRRERKQYEKDFQT